MDALSDDLLVGADAVAKFLFGARETPRKGRRKIYNLRGQLPLFNIGAAICGRKSTLIEYVRIQEAAAAQGVVACQADQRAAVIEAAVEAGRRAALEAARKVLGEAKADKAEPEAVA
jgi:hypothetical protein